MEQDFLRTDYSSQTITAILYVTEEWIKDLQLIEDTLEYSKYKLINPNDN